MLTAGCPLAVSHSSQSLGFFHLCPQQSTDPPPIFWLTLSFDTLISFMLDTNEIHQKLLEVEQKRVLGREETAEQSKDLWARAIRTGSQAQGREGGENIYKPRKIKDTASL